jgi:hypothetical protein
LTSESNSILLKATLKFMNSGSYTRLLSKPWSSDFTLDLREPLSLSKLFRFALIYKSNL